MIYIEVCKSDETTKIGWAKDADTLPNRLKDAKDRYLLQGKASITHSIIQGNKSDETSLHNFFDAYRVPQKDGSKETYQIRGDVKAWLAHLGRSAYAARSEKTLRITEAGAADVEIYPQGRPWLLRNVDNLGVDYGGDDDVLCVEPWCEDACEKYYRGKECNEWWTPAEFVNLVKEVYDGVIHLDPASGPLPQITVGALEYFNKWQKGETRPWCRNNGEPADVMCNPPYDGEEIAFVKHGIKEHKAGRSRQIIFILNADGVNTKWLINGMRSCSGACFTENRINFNSGTRRKDHKRSQNNTIFLYFGPHYEKFRDVFWKTGSVLKGEEK